MSQIETAAIPVMTPMIRGESCTLTQDAQIALWRWMTLKAIILDSEGERRFIPQHAIRRFYDVRVLEIFSKLWIGLYSGSVWSLNARYMRGAGSAAPNPFPFRVTMFDPARAGADPNAPTFQSTTFCIGRLYMHYVTTTDFSAGYRLYDDARSRLIPIGDGKDVAWPPSIPIDDTHAELISTWIYDPNCVAPGLGLL